MKLTPKEKYERWVCGPLAALRALPRGDGAFAALGISCGLYERFIKSAIKRNGEKGTPDLFVKTAAADLGCSEEAMWRFWNGYRLGIQHTFHPKTYTEKEGKGDWWGWEMAEAEGFNYYPEIVKVGAKKFVVRVDPWKFMNHVLQRWEEHSELMNELSEFILGEIAPVERKQPLSVAPFTYLADENPKSYSPHPPEYPVSLSPPPKEIYYGSDSPPRTDI